MSETAPSNEQLICSALHFFSRDFKVLIKKTDPNFTDDHFDKYKGWLKNDQSKQSKILLQLFDDPEKGKQSKELLRQIAQTNKRNNGEMMA